MLCLYQSDEYFLEFVLKLKTNAKDKKFMKKKERKRKFLLTFNRKGY